MELIGTSVELEHETIDDDPPCGKLGFCLTADLTGNGRPDVIVGGGGDGYPGRRFVTEAQERGVPTLAPLRSMFGLDETHLFWYENPGFERHDVATAPDLDVGAAVGDLTGDGTPDVIAGQGLGNTDVYWFEPGEDPREPWTRHLVTDRFEKYHDLAIADVDDDGEPEIVGLSQESETIFYYDVPDDPREGPWSDEHLHIVQEGVHVEGLEVVDVDGDGQTEIVAGQSIYRPDPTPDDGWSRERIVESGWDDTRLAVVDLDRDGDLEIVLAEGDSPEYGTHPGRVAWFDPPDWEPHVLKHDLFCPHSLQVADFSGNGLPDIYVAEMGLESNRNPQHLLFLNRGDGDFEERTVDTGVATHEAKVVDLNDDGRPDVVGKSYGPDHHVDVWYNSD